jgi:hypothetical protein
VRGQHDLVDLDDPAVLVRDEAMAAREHGWGLAIVGALTSGSGAVADDTGKRVWFELDIPAQR